jgi:hypothetical protein
MISNKKCLNYNVIDVMEIYNLGIDNANVQSCLKNLKFWTFKIREMKKQILEPLKL